MAAQLQDSQTSSAPGDRPPTHYSVLIVGGGAAGITVAAQLKQRQASLQIAILEPSDRHCYQPAWTLVGAGAFNLDDTVKPEAMVIPVGVTWVREAAATFRPEVNQVVTRSGWTLSYDYLVVCPGIQLNWGAIEGLPEALCKGGVCSNYSFEHVAYTWEAIQKFKGGRAIFTVPSTPIKCGGAPQKIMYLADDAFRQQGVRDKSEILYCTALGGIFPVPAYAERLLKVVDRRGLGLRLKHELKAVRGDRNEAVFAVTTDAGTEEKVLPYDLLHVTPPMSAPDFIKNSPLAVAGGLGWVDVNKETLQHNVYPNVFSLGDASSLPTSKTAAAVRGQAPVLVENLLALRAQKALSGSYRGYTCCPLITGYGKVIMAEFDYANQPLSSFPLDPREERYSMWLVKRHLLPWLYWNRMLKGAQFEGNQVPWRGWRLD